MSILKQIFNTDGLVRIELEDIPEDLPTDLSQMPDLLHRNDYRSGELQKSCQEALLRLMDHGKPLGALMSPKYTRAAANALLALSHPCPRHLDLFAYCIELFDNGEGGLHLEGRFARKLQSLMAYNPLNLAKILKLHGDEPHFYQLMTPLHELLCLHTILVDDPGLAQRLENLERRNDAFARKSFLMHRHYFMRYLDRAHYTHDSAMRDYLRPAFGISHVEIHDRLSKFLGLLIESCPTELKFFMLPKALKNEYRSEGPSLTPAIEILQTDLTLEEILAFPGIDQFLLDHSFHILQERSTNPGAYLMPVDTERLDLIRLMTRKALQAGHSTDDIYFTSIYHLSRYQRQDLLNQGEDLKSLWMKGALDFSSFSDAGGSHHMVAFAIIEVLLEQEGVEKVMSYDLTDEQLMAAKNITGNTSYAQGLSAKARDQLMERDLGL